MRWSLDGAVLYLYDLPHDESGFRSGLEAALVTARDAGAILHAEVFAGEPAAAWLETAGFSLDWHEPDVRAGKVTRRLGYVFVPGGDEAVTMKL